MTFTHVCLDCGALGVAGDYHDHGGGNAGDTIALAAIPEWVRSWQRIEDQRDEYREALEDMVKEFRAVAKDFRPDDSGYYRQAVALLEDVA